MATKGAHVFHLRKREYAEQWMQSLNIKHYEPALENLNFDYEPLPQTAGISPSPGAFISELPDSNSQLATKRLPDESWQMVQKLSKVLAKSVPTTKTEVPFKFNRCLQDVYECERTPLLSRSTSVASGTRSHDPEPTAENSEDTGVHSARKPSRKRNRADPSSDHDTANSSHAPNDVDSTSRNDERPTKKTRPAERKGTQTQTNSIAKRSAKKGRPENEGPQRSPTPPPIVPDAQQVRIRKPISFDWKKSVPQALVLDFLPENQDSPKIGVWFLPTQMVSLLRSFFPVSLSSLSGSQQEDIVQDPLQRLELYNVLTDRPIRLVENVSRSTTCCIPRFQHSYQK